jgi:hypothetical protein
MDDLRAELQHALAADEEARADYERWEASQLQKRSGGTELIYKTYEPPMQQPSAAMDAATEAKWNEWCDARIHVALEKYSKAYSEVIMDAVGEAFAIERKDMHDYVAKQVAKMLTKEIDWLMTFLKNEVAANKSEVIDLPPWPSKRNVA